MGGIVIENSSSLFSRLNRFSKDIDSEGLFLSDYAHLAGGSELYIETELNNSFYNISIGILDAELSKFSGFHERFRDQIGKRNLQWEFYDSGNGVLLKESGSPYFSYGVNFMKDEIRENQGNLEIYSGKKGLLPRSLSREKDFEANILELEGLANVLFYPFLRAGLKNSEDIPFYYLGVNIQ